MRHIFPGFLALSFMLPAHAGDTDVVARMGDNSLSLGDARQIAEQMQPQVLDIQGLERMIRTELIRRSVASEARKQAFDKKPEVAVQMDRAAEQALVSAYMNIIARPPADYPSDVDLKQAYESNKAAFTTPLQYRVSQIYVSGTDAKAAKLADELYRQATGKKADFAEIARKSSQHQTSAGSGGDMGWLTEKDLVPAIRASLEGLKAGETGKPVATSEGFHILKLMDRKEPELMALDKVRPSLVQTLRLRRAKEIESAYLETLLARSPVAVNGIALSELERNKKR